MALAYEFTEAIEELGCFIVHQFRQNAMLVEQFHPAMAFFFEHLEVAIEQVIGGAIAQQLHHEVDIGNQAAELVGELLQKAIAFDGMFF